MNSPTQLALVKTVAFGLVIVAASVAPKTAAAQARASVQATATVVETKAGFAGLRQAKSAAESWASGRLVAVNDVSTVAQVAVTYHPAAAQSAGAELVVNIDYVKN